MTTKRIEIPPGYHISGAYRKAFFTALKEDTDIVFGFNEVDHNVSLEQAKQKLPELLQETIEEIDSLRTSFDRRLAVLKAQVQEDVGLLQDLLANK